MAVSTEKDMAVTYTKAVGIILMVLAHCSHFPLLYQIVYSFHMPLFFIMSGYCLKDKYFSSFNIFVWKKVKGLWLPYVKYGILFLLLHNVFCKFHIYGELCGQKIYGSGDFVEQLENILFHMFNTEPFPGGFWFLRALFFGSLIAFIVLKISCATNLNKRIAVNVVVGGALIAWTTINYQHKTFTLFYIGPTEFMAATFFTIGYSLAQMRIPRFSVWQSVLAFSILVLNSYYNLLGIQGPFYETQKIIPYTVTAVLGTWCVYSLPWSLLNERVKSFLEYVGNHTLAILTWHFLCFKLVSIIIVYIYKLPMVRIEETPTIGEYDNRGWFLLSTIVGICIPLLLTYSYEKICIRIKEIYR